MRADFRLEDWTIRPRLDCIERGNRTVHIHPKPMAVLLRLAQARGKVVTRDELFDAVWPGVVVTDDALTQCVVELRKAFGDPAHEPKFIKTIPKVGFCLVPPVREVADERESSDGNPELQHSVTASYGNHIRQLVLAATVVAALALAMFWTTETSRNDPIAAPVVSIAVLPFVDMSETGDLEYFSDGLAEELINTLARVEGLTVASRISSFKFKGKNEDIRVIGGTLGVRYILEGCVRKDGERLRITAQLLDASSGFHLWSDTYDRDLDEIFELQYEISTAIVHALKRRLGIEPEGTPL